MIILIILAVIIISAIIYFSLMYCSKKNKKKVVNVNDANKVKFITDEAKDKREHEIKLSQAAVEKQYHNMIEKPLYAILMNKITNTAKECNYYKYIVFYININADHISVVDTMFDRDDAIKNPNKYVDLPEENFCDIIINLTKDLMNHVYNEMSVRHCIAELIDSTIKSNGFSVIQDNGAKYQYLQTLYQSKHETVYEEYTTYCCRIGWGEQL